jgi:hypothetical protein
MGYREIYGGLESVRNCWRRMKARQNVYRVVRGDI